MQFIDLRTQYKRIEASVKKRIETVLEHGQFILGPEVTELENQLKAYVGVHHCFSVSNGTDAILMALMALGIGPGDEVITSPFSFFAAPECLALLGAKTVFVDIDPQTFNLDPKKLEERITPRTKAIIPIDLYGQCADYDAILAVADWYNIPVIEDAAQAFGASYRRRKAGSFGAIACTSFYPAKSLGAYGEGGAVFTNNEELAHKLKSIRVHGQEGKYVHVRLGLNARLETLQAAILLSKLEIFDDEAEKRQLVASRYDQLLKDHFQTPFIASYNQSIYAQYTLMVEDRDALRAHLQERGVPTDVHYPVAIHRQPYFFEQYKDEHYPHSEEAARKVLSLPMHPYLTEAQQNQVAEALISFKQKSSAAGISRSSTATL